ncbi:hypothetical protein chiPu_0032807, partial [Chiloscyllium punctatum]|nr:hypothetical protein [Chiloscyllium punctatum]
MARLGPAPWPGRKRSVARLRPRQPWLPQAQDGGGIWVTSIPPDLKRYRRLRQRMARYVQATLRRFKDGHCDAASESRIVPAEAACVEASDKAKRAAFRPP